MTPSLILVERADRAGQADLAELLEDAVAPPQHGAVVGADPEAVGLVDEQGGDVGRLQRRGAVAVEGPELDPVEAHQPGLGAEPEEPVGVLGQGPDAVGRQAVAGLPALEVVLGERLRLSGRPAPARRRARPPEPGSRRAPRHTSGLDRAGTISTRAWMRKPGRRRGAVRRTVYRPAPAAGHQISRRKNAAAQVGFRTGVCRMIAPRRRSPSMRSRIPTALGACLLASTLALWARPGCRRLDRGSGCGSSTARRPRSPAAGPRRTDHAAETALDRYVKAPDPAFRFSVVATRPGEGHTAYLLEMVSQRWLTTARGRPAGMAPLADHHQAGHGRPPDRASSSSPAATRSASPPTRRTPASSTSR